MSENIVPIDGENQKKRVVGFHYFFRVSDKRNFNPCVVLFFRFRYRWISLWTWASVCLPYIILCDGVKYYFFNSPHRMKPTRIRMCHSLVMNYGLYKKMEIFVRIQIIMLRKFV